MLQPLPDYVAQVIAGCQATRPRALRLTRRPLPEPFSPIVICVLKNERDRLRDFLRHYREAGIERFAFIDNGSSDGTVEYLAAQPDADVYTNEDSFHWIAKQGWINRLIQTYGHDRWYIYADADEHIVFEDIGARGFADLTRTMQGRGIQRVRGFLVDMYAATPLLEPDPIGDRPLAQVCPYFDHTGYAEARYREIMSVKGGPRIRAFGRADAKFNPEMSKYPLFRIGPGEYMVNPHHIWPLEPNFISPRLLGILHFKFLADTARRIQDAVERGNYWDGSFEYRCYAKVLAADPTLSLIGAPSRRYRDAGSLLDSGLIVPVDWPRQPGAGVGVRAAYHRRRAAMMDTPLPPAVAPEPPAPRLPATPPRSEPSQLTVQDSDFVGFI